MGGRAPPAATMRRTRCRYRGRPREVAAARARPTRRTRRRPDGPTVRAMARAPPAASGTAEPCGREHARQLPRGWIGKPCTVGKAGQSQSSPVSNAGPGSEGRRARPCRERVTPDWRRPRNAGQSSGADCFAGRWRGRRPRGGQRGVSAAAYRGGQARTGCRSRVPENLGPAVLVEVNVRTESWPRTLDRRCPRGRARTALTSAPL